MRKRRLLSVVDAAAPDKDQESVSPSVMKCVG